MLIASKAYSTEFTKNNRDETIMKRFNFRPKVLNSAIAASCLTFGSAAWASCPAPIANEASIPCVLGNGDSLSVLSGGSLMTSGSSAVSTLPGATAGNIAIASGGTISADSQDFAISVAGTGTSLNSVVNNGTISGQIGIFLSMAGIGSINNSGTIQSANGNALYLGTLSSISGGITNSGTIQSAGGNALIMTSTAQLSGGITNSGVIQSTGGTGNAIHVTSTAALSGGINNTGSILSSGANGVEVNVNSTVDSINNNTGGVIQGGESGIAINSGSFVGSINNSGVITGNKADAIFVSVYSGITGGITGGITNSGTIQSTSGNGIGVDSASSIASGINNSGTIQSASGDAIHVSESSQITGGITNSGNIQSASGNGIGVYNNSSIDSINNSGTISGGSYAIYIDPTSHVTNGITNSGVINGAVALNDAALMLDGNSGQITGAVSGAAGSSVTVNGVFNNQNSFNVGSFNISSGGTLNLTSTGQAFDIQTSSGLSNAGTLAINGPGWSWAIVNGNVTNQASGLVEISNNVAAFNGNVVNDGSITAKNATINFNGNYLENGSYISSHSHNEFSGSVTISSSGYWASNQGSSAAGLVDTFFVSGDLINNSTQNSLWNTNAAMLIFDGSSQTMALAGSDLGATSAGYTYNFAWGDFILNAGDKLTLTDGHAGSAALYVGVFDLVGGISQIASINSPFNIYYDPYLAGNAYLNDQTYSLNGGGFLIADAAAPAAVPLPASLWLFGSALAGWLGFSRRKQAGF